MKKNGFITAVALVLATINLASGAIAVGDILVVDFGKTGQETTGNWNNAAKAANAQFTANGEVLVSDMVRYSDANTTGVQLIWDEVDGSSSYAGIGGAVVASVGSSASFTGVGTIPDNAQIDTSYFNGNQSFLQLTGLDAGQTYNLEIMSRIDAARNTQFITVNGTVLSVDPDDTNYITAFNEISATAGGVIQIDISSAGGGASLQHINALALTAVTGSGTNTPPPSFGFDENWMTASDFGPFAVAVTNDGTVALSVSANGQRSGPDSDGSEWDIRQGISTNVATSAEMAVSMGSYIEFTLDSTPNLSEWFSLDSFSLSLWRNGSQSASSYQLAYSSDATWMTDELLGTATYSESNDVLTLTADAAELPDTMKTGVIRLYHWDAYDDGSANHPNASANFHLTDVSVAYTATGYVEDNELAPRPNIVLIFMDDMGYNDIGIQTYPSPASYYPNAGPSPKLNGNSDPDIPAPNEARLLTPTIDTLAEDGLRMTSFHTARLCSPSRAKLLTGRYASRMNLDRVFNPNKTTGFSTREVTLPEKLRELGYATGMVGKWHLGYNPSQAQPFQMMPTRNGFQEFYGTPHSNDMDDYHLIQNETILIENMGEGETYQTELTWRFTEAALDFMERTTANDQPFFLYFAHAMTHIPCWPSNQEFTNADGTTWPKFKGSSGVSYYYDVIKEVDHSVSRVLSKLSDLGIADDTLVIFTSDNGPWLNLSGLNLQENAVGSAYPLKDGKFTTWEGGCRVPFLVRWPGQIAAGGESGQVGGLIDLLPTLVPLAGGSVPPDRTIDGVDLWPVWSGQTNELDRTYAMFYDGTAQGVMKENWKLRNGQLYDLDADIQEETNLSGDAANSAILAELTAFKSSIESSAANDVEPLGVFTSYEVEISTNDLRIAEGGTATVDVRLSHSPGAEVTVSVSRFSGDLDLSVSAGSSLAFTTSNWSSWQTVTLAAAQDMDADHDGATFRVTTSGHNFVRELFVFEVDDEAAVATSASLVWPKVPEFTTSSQTVKLVAEGRVQFGAEIDPAGSVYRWKKVSGPGAVTFMDASANLTGVSFSTTGTYQLRFVADHTNASAFSSVDFTANVGVEEAGVNVAPVVSAGSDQSIDYTIGVELNGAVSDDGLPANSTLNTLWREVDGPGIAAIADDFLPSTTVDFDLTGTYELWLEADDGAVKVYDEVSISADTLSFSEWTAGVGLPEGQDGAEDNPDNDSFNNYWEWVLGLDPEGFDAPMSLGYVAPSGISNTVHFTFMMDVPRNRMPDLWLETCEDLLSRWTAASNLVPQIEVLNAGTNRWTFELEVDADDLPRLFARPVGTM